MIENSENPKVASEITPETLNFQEGIKKAENFGQLYQFFNKMSDRFVGDDGIKYSGADLEILVKGECKQFDYDGDMKGSILRLKKISEILAQKFPKLIEQWLRDREAIELES